MKILFFSHYFSPHIGGVEKHVYKLSQALIKKGHKITVITEKFDPNLKNEEIINKIKVIRFSYLKQKFLGLIFIWYFFWQNRDLFKENDIIHIHDVFIWYFPFRFLYPNKKVYTTIHGLEWGNPFSKSGMLQKKLAVKLSTKSIGVGSFLEKYIKTKFDLIIYGATDSIKTIRKEKNSIVFVGRFSKDTGVLKFLDYLSTHQKLKPIFVGDGEYRKKCEEYGKVVGFTDPQKFIQKAQYLVPGGYLACLEGFASKCKIKIFPTTKLKQDYWKLSPMFKFIKDENIEKAYNWAHSQTWSNLADEMLALYNSSK